MSLLESELHLAVGEFASDDPHIAHGQVDWRTGQPAADFGGRGEQSHARQLAVAPGVVGLSLLESEFDFAVGEFASDDPCHSISCGLLAGGR